MGLFDGLKKKSKLDFTTDYDALMTLLVAIGSLDGDIDDDELATIVSITNINPSLDSDDSHEAFEFASKYVMASGAHQSAVDALNYIPDDLHETAFSYACLVALADGVVTQEEEDTLIQLSEVSDEIDEDKAMQIVSTCGTIMTPF